MTLHAKPDAGERLGSLLFALGGVAITLSLVGAIWAANSYRAESHALPSGSRQEVSTAAPVVATARTLPTKRADVPQHAVVGGVPHASTWQTARAPLAWNELTLMLRTGLTDDEVIAASAGKQLTVSIGPDEARQLRELGAGSRLIGYLQGRAIYNAPASVPVQVVNARKTQVSAPQVSRVPAATPYPTVDYAARDRQVASLKKQIDSLDDQIRVARSRPNDYIYPGVYGTHCGDSTSRQQAADGYIKSLEEERDNLRHQKWQLEGR